MDPIPINFNHNGTKYTDCYFTRIAGSGQAAIWHLHDNDNYYLGKLRYTNQWVFDANKKSTGIDQLGEFFGEFVKKANSNFT
jgi:hypothetical protein